jgi:hypothetical protein
MESPKNSSVAKADRNPATGLLLMYSRVSTAGQQEEDVPERTGGHQPCGTLIRLVALVKKSLHWKRRKQDG